MKRILIALLCFAVLSVGCAGKHPADLAAVAIVPATQSYEIAQDALLNLHDTCAALKENCPQILKPIVTNWNRIDDINDQVDAQFKVTHDAWILLSQANTPENEAQFAEQLRLLSQLVAKLAEFIPNKEGE